MNPISELEFVKQVFKRAVEKIREDTSITSTEKGRALLCCYGLMKHFALFPSKDVVFALKVIVEVLTENLVNKPSTTDSSIH